VKGVIFNLLEEVVRSEHGEDAWDEVLEGTGVDGAYTAVGSYPDAELGRLVAYMSNSLGSTPTELLRWFGVQAIPLLAERYAVFFTGHESTKSFLLTLNDVIHAEVRKLHPDAEVPDFEFISGWNGEPPSAPLVIRYRSKRRLCALAEGFIEGVAAYFDEAVLIEQSACMHRGDEWCDLICAVR
jgi:hypothetical protein